MPRGERGGGASWMVVKGRKGGGRLNEIVTSSDFVVKEES